MSSLRCQCPYFLTPQNGYASTKTKWRRGAALHGKDATVLLQLETSVPVYSQLGLGGESPLIPG